MPLGKGLLPCVYQGLLSEAMHSTDLVGPFMQTLSSAGLAQIRFILFKLILLTCLIQSKDSLHMLLAER